MPVQSFTIQDILPELVAGSITYVSEMYNETHGLAGMANEMRPQIDPKIMVKGKAVKRYVAGDIPEGSEATFIKDSRFTEEAFTAPEYGKGFNITINQLLLNPEYAANFNQAVVTMRGVERMQSMLQSGANECINMIKRAEDKQVKDILDNATIQLNNYTDIDFGRDVNNSKVITTANLKWTIANASTMTPFDDIDLAAEQVADRGNSGDAEFIFIMGRDAYKAYINSDAYKADSDIRRNYRIQKVPAMNSTFNKNIPAGAVYRETITQGAIGIYHIFTYNQTFTSDAGAETQWIDKNKVYCIATDNVIQRQPVQMMTFSNYAYGTSVRAALRRMPQMNGWLIEPEMNKTTNRAMVWGVYKKFLTLALTPNKTYTLTVADAV